MAEPIIELKDVRRTYTLGDETLRALDGVNLVVQEAEFIAVMGPSGSGKSTLMNVLGCLDRPSAGAYFLDGHEVSTLDKAALAGVRNRTIGFVFQSFNLLSRTTALENVELPLIYAGAPRKEREKRAREALLRVGLGERLGHRPSQLSGGQQQRVAIARAIVNTPKLVLADEPTGNLDSRTSLEVMALFQELWDDGLTVVIVTHEPDIAQFASRVVVVKDGRIRSDTRQSARRATEDLATMVTEPSSGGGA